MSFFHPFTDAKLQENSAEAIEALFEGRYRVRSVKPGFGDNYYVRLEDGHTMRVKVGEKTNLFGEKRAFVKWIDE